MSTCYRVDRQWKLSQGNIVMYIISSQSCTVVSYSNGIISHVSASKYPARLSHVKNSSLAGVWQSPGCAQPPSSIRQRPVWRVTSQTSTPLHSSYTASCIPVFTLTNWNKRRNICDQWQSSIQPQNSEQIFLLWKINRRWSQSKLEAKFRLADWKCDQFNIHKHSTILVAVWSNLVEQQLGVWPASDVIQLWEQAGGYAWDWCWLQELIITAQLQLLIGYSTLSATSCVLNASSQSDEW